MRLTSSAGLASALGSRCAGCDRPGALLCSRCAVDSAACRVVAPVEHVDRVLAPWAYEGAPRDLILALKLRGRRGAAEPLIEGMARTAQAETLRAEAIVWVPGRRVDTRVRGYDHAEVLARGVAKALGLPAPALLRRVAEPPDQTTLGAEARRRNLQGAFLATPSRFRRVAIVDDLVTTGATLAVCAGALRATGAGFVEGLAPCRA